MWTTGLIHKLYNLVIKDKLLRIINNTFQGASIRVLYNGYLSETFQIMQGTRQGSICAPFHYTIHVNGLLDELQRSVHGLRVGELKLSAPTQADDIVLLSTLRLGIEKVVSICRNYANKWRYSYNAAKCASMVMSHKQARCHRPEAIRYGNSNITETTVYKHLGVTHTVHNPTMSIR